MVPHLPIGQWGEEVIDYMTDHLGGLFDAVKEVLNFCRAPCPTRSPP